MPDTIFKPENNTQKESISITKFENDVLRLLCKEKNPKEISVKLGVSIHTIQAYKTSILEKFQTKSTNQLKQLLKNRK